MMDLEHTDWYFASLLYDTLYDEIDKRRKHEEEENKRREQEMSTYQQMQDYQSKMMDNMNSFQMPSSYE